MLLLPHLTSQAQHIFDTRHPVFFVKLRKEMCAGLHLDYIIPAPPHKLLRGVCVVPFVGSCVSQASRRRVVAVSCLFCLVGVASLCSLRLGSASAVPLPSCKVQVYI